MIEIRNKIDLVEDLTLEPGYMYVSANYGTGLDHLR